MDSNFRVTLWTLDKVMGLFARNIVIARSGWFVDRWQRIN